MIGPDDLQLEGDAFEPPARPPQETLAAAERRHIQAVLDHTGWNKQRAAAALEVSRGTLYRKIHEYRLRPSSRADL